MFNVDLIISRRPPLFTCCFCGINFIMNTDVHVHEIAESVTLRFVACYDGQTVRDTEVMMVLVCHVYRIVLLSVGIHTDKCVVSGLLSV